MEGEQDPSEAMMVPCQVTDQTSGESLKGGFGGPLVANVVLMIHPQVLETQLGADPSL